MHISQSGQFLTDPIQVIKDILNLNYMLDLNDIPFGYTGIPQNFSESDIESTTNALKMISVDVLNNNKLGSSVTLGNIYVDPVTSSKFIIEFKYNNVVDKVEITR